MDYYNYNVEIRDLDLKEASRVHGQCFSSDSDSEDGKEELDEIYFQNRLTIDLEDTPTQIIKAKSYSSVLKSSLQNDDESGNQVPGSSVKKIDNTNVSKGTETMEAVKKKSKKKKKKKKNKKDQIPSVEDENLISHKQNKLSNVHKIQLHTSDELENVAKPATLLLQALTLKADALLTEKVQTPIVQNLHTNVTSQLKGTSSQTNIQNGKSPFYNENSVEDMLANSTVSDLDVNNKNRGAVIKLEKIDEQIQIKQTKNKKKRQRKALKKEVMRGAEDAADLVETQERTESKSLESLRVIFSRVFRKFAGSSLSFEQSFGKLYDQHSIFTFTECIHLFVLKDLGRMKCLKMYLTHPKRDRVSCAERDRFFVRFIIDVLHMEDLELRTDILPMTFHDKKLTFIDADGKKIEQSVEIVNPTPNIPLTNKGKVLYLDTCTLTCSDKDSERNQVTVCSTNKSLSTTVQTDYASIPENSDTSLLDNNYSDNKYSDFGSLSAGSSVMAHEKMMQKQNKTDVEELRKINMKLNQSVQMQTFWQALWSPLLSYSQIHQSQIFPSNLTHNPGMNRYMLNNVSRSINISHNLNFMSHQQIESHRRPIFIPEVISTSLIKNNQINNTVCGVPQVSSLEQGAGKTFSRNENSISTDKKTSFQLTVSQNNNASLIQSDQIDNKTVCDVFQGSHIEQGVEKTFSRNENAIPIDETKSVARKIQPFDSQLTAFQNSNPNIYMKPQLSQNECSCPLNTSKMTGIGTKSLTDEDVVLSSKTKSITQRIQTLQCEPGTSRHNICSQDINTSPSETKFTSPVNSVERVTLEFKPVVSQQHEKFQYCDCESDQRCECSLNDSSFSLTGNNYTTPQNSFSSETSSSQLSENLEDNIKLQCPVCKAFFIHNCDKEFELELDGKNSLNQTLPGKSNQNCDISKEDWNSVFIYINFYLVFLGCLYAVLQLVTCLE